MQNFSMIVYFKLYWNYTHVKLASLMYKSTLFVNLIYLITRQPTTTAKTFTSRGFSLWLTNSISSLVIDEMHFMCHFVKTYEYFNVVYLHCFFIYAPLPGVLKYRIISVSRILLYHFGIPNVTFAFYAPPQQPQLSIK